MENRKCLRLVEMAMVGTLFLLFLMDRMTLYDEHDFMMVQNSSISAWQ
jgi:hypothetical protein